MSPRVEFGNKHRVPEIDVLTVRFDRMRRAHEQLLVLGKSSSSTSRRLQDCLSAILQAVMRTRQNRCRGTFSLRRDDDLEIFARHNKRVLAAAIHPLKQLDDLSLQGGLSCRIQCRKCAVGRAVICLEDFEPMARRFVSEAEDLLGSLQLVATKQLTEAAFGSPKRGRLDPGRRRNVLADDLEELADETIGRPIGEADTATLANDARELGRSRFLVWSEHHTKRR